MEPKKIKVKFAVQAQDDRDPYIAVIYNLTRTWDTERHEDVISGDGVEGRGDNTNSAILDYLAVRLGAKQSSSAPARRTN